MRIALVAAVFGLVSLLGATVGAAAEPLPTPASCSRIEPDGGRTLCHELVVPAGREAVWALLSTSEGLRTWAAPVVALDLRIGGLWEASYNPRGAPGDPANIRNRVLSFAPGRMLSIQVEHAPPGFPHGEEARETWSVIELQDEGPAATRVRVSGMGYRAGAAFDELYAFFERGNAWTLQRLYARIVSGPADWAATSAPGAVR